MTMKIELPPMKVTMTATGKVVNPDGREYDITLTAEKPLVTQEKESGNHPLKRGIDRSD